MTAAASFYETDKAISEYLLFHYGENDAFLLDGIGPIEALDFAKRCADLAQRHDAPRGRALDLGCAVGRSACELSAHYDEVLGIDFSFGLIEAAQRVVDGAEVEIEIADEGNLTKPLTIRRPNATRPETLRFQQGDAMNLSPELGSFDFVLMANLVDRLPDPATCLESIAFFVNSGGLLAITSPFTWLEEYTAPDKWLGGFSHEGKPVRSFETIQKILSPNFEELETLNLPFLIREHARKNQYSIAHASIWRRK